MDLLHGLDLLSTFVFALVGARVAADKRLDYGGIAFIAVIASVSGGTLRNIFLGLKPIWITDPSIIAAVILAVVITLVFRRVTRIGKTLLIMDTFGLAVAAMSGTQLAYEMDVVWFGAIFNCSPFLKEFWIAANVDGEFAVRIYNVLHFLIGAYRNSAFYDYNFGFVCSECDRFSNSKNYLCLGVD
jgi:hypothetical protein